MDIGNDGSDVESGSESYVSSLMGEIRVGDEYQASVPNVQACKPFCCRTMLCSQPHYAVVYDIDELPIRLANPRQLWAPDQCSLTEPQCKTLLRADVVDHLLLWAVESFIKAAREQSSNRFSLDQVLGMLYWNEFDQRATLDDLKQLERHPGELQAL